MLSLISGGVVLIFSVIPICMGGACRERSQQEHAYALESRNCPPGCKQLVVYLPAHAHFEIRIRHGQTGRNRAGRTTAEHEDLHFQYGRNFRVGMDNVIHAVESKGCMPERCALIFNDIINAERRTRGLEKDLNNSALELSDYPPDHPDLPYHRLMNETSRLLYELAVQRTIALYVEAASCTGAR